MHFRIPNPVRRLLAALAVAQLAVTALVPLAEARLERSPGPVSIEQQHSTECVTVHRPDACLLCQHLLTRAQASKPAAPLPGSCDVPAVAVERNALRAAPATRHEPPPRAPPLLSA